MMLVNSVLNPSIIAPNLQKLSHREVSINGGRMDGRMEGWTNEQTNK